MSIEVADIPRLREAVDRVRRIEPGWMASARARLETLTKPPGSLGRLEHLAARLCAIQETLSPRAAPRRVIVFAADHGVAAEGVSAYPAAVTAQMVANFVRGGAAINVLARLAGADVYVVDVGVQGPVDAAHGEARLVRQRVGEGTRNMACGPAMTAAELAAAIGAGLDAAASAAADGVAVLVCGDMGIANTTAASAITAVLTGRPPLQVTGRGTGIGDEQHRHKAAVVARAVAANAPETPLDALAALGGFEIAAIAGACIGAAGHRLAVVGDGFVATAATLAAAAICPGVLDYWIAGHRSSEPGHAVQLAHLGQDPLLDLGMRLGEGTGAVLALPLLDAAVATFRGMATFESAGISGRGPAPAGTR